MCEYNFMYASCYRFSAYVYVIVCTCTCLVHSCSLVDDVLYRTGSGHWLYAFTIMHYECVKAQILSAIDHK